MLTCGSGERRRLLALRSRGVHGAGGGEMAPSRAELRDRLGVLRRSVLTPDLPGPKECGCPWDTGIFPSSYQLTASYQWVQRKKGGGGVVNLVSLIVRSVRHLVRRNTGHSSSRAEGWEGGFLAKRNAISSLQGPLQHSNSGKIHKGVLPSDTACNGETDSGLEQASRQMLVVLLLSHLALLFYHWPHKVTWDFWFCQVLQTHPWSEAEFAVKSFSVWVVNENQAVEILICVLSRLPTCASQETTPQSLIHQLLSHTQFSTANLLMLTCVKARNTALWPYSFGSGRSRRATLDSRGCPWLRNETWLPRGQARACSTLASPADGRGGAAMTGTAALRAQQRCGEGTRGDSRGAGRGREGIVCVPGDRCPHLHQASTLTDWGKTETKATATLKPHEVLLVIYSPAKPSSELPSSPAPWPAPCVSQTGTPGTRRWPERRGADSAVAETCVGGTAAALPRWENPFETLVWKGLCWVGGEAVWQSRRWILSSPHPSRPGPLFVSSARAGEGPPAPARARGGAGPPPEHSGVFARKLGPRLCLLTAQGLAWKCRYWLKCILVTQLPAISPAAGKLEKQTLWDKSPNDVKQLTVGIRISSPCQGMHLSKCCFPPPGPARVFSRTPEASFHSNTPFRGSFLLLGVVGNRAAGSLQPPLSKAPSPSAAEGCWRPALGSGSRRDRAASPPAPACP